jgi:hypothetical protein
MRRSPLAILNVLIVRRKHAGLLPVASRLRLAGVNRYLIRLVQEGGDAFAALLVLRVRSFALTITILARVGMNLVESLLRTSLQAAVARLMTSDYLAITVCNPTASSRRRV